MSFTLSIDRNRLVERYQELARVIHEDERWIVDTLSSISPYATARDEVAKTVRALSTYHEELEALRSRAPMGAVGVALPFNNPLYSLILYCFGAMLGGSKVIVRPSRITSPTMVRIFSRYGSHLSQLPIKLTTASGAAFINEIIRNSEIQTLIFTGSYINLTEIIERFPKNKTLIYCGSGINPFIAGPMQDMEMSFDEAVNLLISTRIYNSGQDCLCTERVYLHTSIADAFIELLDAKLGSLHVGDFGDPEALVVPLLGDLAERSERLVNEAVGLRAIKPYNREDKLVYPSVFEVSLGHPLLMIEKLAPMFVVSRYNDQRQVNKELEAEYRFGATIVGNFESAVLRQYPHVTIARSVLEYEAENVHTPFGGCGRSGFVRGPEGNKDGPILYSIETTTLVNVSDLL